MSKSNILRIKFNGTSILKLSRSNKGKDYIFSIPIVKNGNIKIQCHFTLHTSNSRYTYKTTSIRENEIEKLPILLQQIKKHPVYQNKVTYYSGTAQPKDLDLHGVRYIDFNEGNKITMLDTIALNMVGKSVEEFFSHTKTEDRKFKYIKEINSPNDEVSVKWGIGKNYKGTISDYIKKSNDYIFFEDKSETGDIYSFLFLIKYEFPKNIRNKKKRL